MSRFYIKTADNEQNAFSLIYNTEMSGRINIDTKRCKGCGLCVITCRQGGITISKTSNKAGYFPAEAVNSNCTGCAMCAIICPEAAIEVFRDDDSSIQPAKSNKPSLIKGKA